MAIIITEPGSAIATADVESSWGSVRTRINAQSPGSLRRDALNRFQVDRVLATAPGTNRGRDYTFTNTPVTVDHAFVSTSSSDIRSHWQNVLTLDGTPGTAGYQHGICTGIITASVFVGDTLFADDTGALMAVTVEVDGGSATKIDEGDWRFAMIEPLSLVAGALHGGGEIDTSMHLWTVYESAAATLTRVKLWVATTDATNTWTMDNASLGLYLFNRIT